MFLYCLKGNQKEKENKMNIKSEKLNKRKEKLLVSKVFYNKNQIGRKLKCLADISRAQESEYQKEKLMTYLNGWEYWCVA